MGWSKKRASSVFEPADVSFNTRTAHGIYQTLQQYLNECDKRGFDEEIDMDFRSVRIMSGLG